MPQSRSTDARIARLEMAMHYETMMIETKIKGLDSRLTTIERSPLHLGLGAPAKIKLLLAFGVPIGVLLATGSVEKALQAQKLLGGP